MTFAQLRNFWIKDIRAFEDLCTIKKSLIKDIMVIWVKIPFFSILSISCHVFQTESFSLGFRDISTR